MKTDELKATLELMREFNVTELKVNDCSIVMSTHAVKPNLITTPRQLTEEEHKDIISKIENMKSVMQLDDDSLISRMWPSMDPEKEAEA